jgi:hypothetical protein
MNEQQWLQSLELRELWGWHPDSGKDEKRIARKVRLFAVACSRRMWYLLNDVRLTTGVEVAERFADGLATQEELSVVSNSLSTEDGIGFIMLPSVPQGAYEAVGWTISASRDLYLSEAVSAADWIRSARVGHDPLPVREQEQRRLSLWKAEEHKQGYLLHCIFGNPFRPVTIDTVWQTSTVVALANAAYDNRNMPAGTLEPARLAVLADALEEAGCTDADILNHLRQPGEHVRGCWAVDLLLGKE